MANQWAYNQAFSNVGDFISRLMLRDQERKRQEEERQKRNSQIQGVLEQLNKGGQYQVGDQLSNPLTQEKFNLQNIVPQKATGLRAGLGDIPKESMQTEQPSPTFKDMLNSGKTKGKESGYREYTPQDKIALAMQLTQIPGGSEALDNYAQMQKMFKPEVDEYTNIVDSADGKRFGISKKTGKYVEIPGSDKIQKKQEVKYFDNQKYGWKENPDKTLTEDKNLINPGYKPKASYINTEFDDKTGKFVDTYGYYEDDKLIVPEGGKRYIAPVKKSNKTGKTYISKEANLLLNDMFKQQQKIAANYNAMASGQGLYDSYGGPITKKVEEEYEDGSGTLKKRMKDVPVTLDDISRSMASHNAKYINLVKKSMPESLKEWYKELYNTEDKTSNKKAGSNPNQKSFWASLMNAYKKGEIDESAFQYGAHLYRATYLSDPLTEFGKSIPQDDEETFIEEEE